MATRLKQTIDRPATAAVAAPARPTFLRRAELRLLLFGGKGGVGKTTCAAATALHLAHQARHERYLLVSTDPAQSLGDVLSAAPLPPNLVVREIDASAGLARFKQMHGQHLEQIALRGTLLDEQDVAQLLELSLPGLDEIMAFHEVAGLVQSRAYACIVVDTAPTGHTLRLLALPDTLRNWLHALDAMLAKHRCMVQLHRRSYRKEDVDLFLEDLAAIIERLATLLGDPHQCGFVPVTLAEPVTSAETVRLVRRLADMNIPVQELLVNRMCDSHLDCPLCRTERQQQREELARLCAQLPRHALWRVPRQGAEVRGLDELTRFWADVRPIDQAAARFVPAHRAESAATAHSPTDAVADTPRVENPAQLPPPRITLLLFGGKGGAGKTTLASATALRLVQVYQNRRVLLVSTDPAHSLSDVFGVQVGPRGVELEPRLTALEADADEELAELRAEYVEEVEEFFDSLTGGTMANMTFDREVVERLLDLSPPGLDEVMALTRIIELLETGQHDIVVCDAAPSGHLIRLLQLPGLVQDWLRVFFTLLLKYRHLFRFPALSQRLVAMSKRVKVLRALLADAQKARLCVVALPTEMALAETRDLYSACQRVPIHVPAIFLNQVRPAGTCALCADLTVKETTVRERFEQLFPDVRQTVVHRYEPPRGLDRLRDLGQALYKSQSATRKR